MTATGNNEKRDARAKFIELANKRVTKAIKDIRLVGNLSNRRAYKYEDADAKKMIRALQRELDVLKARFRGDDGDDDSIFSL
jgi:transcription elongation GreA/GreB family factor